MKPIRVLLADDEKPARTRLLDLLQKQPDMEVVAVAADGCEAAALIRERQPELVFLDVQMPELDGFGVLREIGVDCVPVIVFVTAYDKYAIQAFDSQALDYLLKPFSDERFEASLERARTQIRARDAGDSPAPLERLVVRSPGRVTFLKVEEIDWIEAAGVYVYLHTAGKAILYRATVGQMLARLDPQQFVRIHRSTVINTGRIRELQLRSHRDYVVILNDGTELMLSRSYRPLLEKWLRQPL